MIPIIHDDTICALSTAPGIGGIAVIRISGKDSKDIFQKIFNKKDIQSWQSHTAHFGYIKDKDRIVDEVVATYFQNPTSFTGEDVIEISCHGSVYIQQQIIQLLIDNGARIAKQGEFTMRAFANGKMDLSQAEAVADLIASENAGSHKLAMQQMRGGFSKEINSLREKLIHFASLIELELDFGEEDVEFADRDDLKILVDELLKYLRKLVDSFQTGNVIKNGVPIAITGAPNMGKSTLLNALLNEDKAIVSEIAGTTRDVIEDSIVLGGISFRFIDTAGIRDAKDEIESIGIDRAFEKANEASVILYLIDAVETSRDELKGIVSGFREKIEDENKKLIILANKIDKAESQSKLKEKFEGIENLIFLSAKLGDNIDALKQELIEFVNLGEIGNNDSIVTNSRHYEALSKAQNSLVDVRQGLDTNLTGDFLATDIRKALHHLGEITGEITTDDLLDNIFSRFCIGK